MSTDQLPDLISDWLATEAPSGLPADTMPSALARAVARRQARAFPGMGVSWRPHSTARRAFGGLAVLGVLAVVSALVLRPIAPAPTQPVVMAGAPSTSASPAAPSPQGLAIVELDGTIRMDLGLPRDAWMPDLSDDGAAVVFITGSHEVGFCGGCGGGVRPALVPVGEVYGAFVYAGPPEGADQADQLEVWQPVLSPDGTAIAFQGVERTIGSDPASPNRDIYVARLREVAVGVVGGDVTRLTTDPAVDEFPTWSRDGSTIFFSNGGDQPLDDAGFSSTQEIWRVPADGGEPTRLTANNVAETMPDVSGDGRIGYWRSGEIWDMREDGSDQRPIPGLPSFDRGVFNPRWSPDGTRLALLRYDPGERAAADPAMTPFPSLPLLEVVVVDLATGDVSSVGPRVASDVNPVSWTPDGTALLINRYDTPR